MPLDKPSNPQVTTPEELEKLSGRKVSFYWLDAYRHLDENGNTAHFANKERRLNGTIVTNGDSLYIRLPSADDHHDMPVKKEHFPKYEFELVD